MKLNLLPIETFTIQIQDSIPVVRQKLLAYVKNSSIVINHQNQSVFTGQVSEHGFKISRIINYQNPFLPIICGGFEHISGETVIYVEMKLNPAVSRFLYLYYGIYFGTVLLIFTRLALRILEIFKVTTTLVSVPTVFNLLTPLIMLMVLVKILILPQIFRRSFWNEVKIDRSKLRQVFFED